MNSRAGAALPMALFTIALVGALAAAALTVSRLRWLGGSRALLSASARLGAEASVDHAARRWDPFLAESLPVGGMVTGAVAGWGATDSLLRLDERLFLVSSVGERRTSDGYLLARHVARELVELSTPALTADAAVTTHGPVVVDPGAQVAGEDIVPAEWEGRCPTPDSVDLPVRYDTLSGFDRLRPVGAEDLLRWADRTVAGAVGGLGPALDPDGGCDRTDSLNWGDPGVPAGPCGPWSPIVAAESGTRLNSGSAQGLIVAPHGLELSGTARFYGVILTSGPLILLGQAAVIGAVYSDSGVTLRDQTSIQRSTCVARSVIARSARPFRRVPRGDLAGQ
ncbi:MAG TPA: hypothetical protein VMG41_15075 [Gemmatimonadales bacterium]|nr:hypothetical protein [Gemmatimonadales bacterium]